jgi:type I restriction enzyme R subunit
MNQRNTIVGQIERRTQQRIIDLFKGKLQYTYWGDWTDRENNHCVEPTYLKAYLAEAGYSDDLASRAIFLLEKDAHNSGASLYDRNKAVYHSLRYGVKVKADVGENATTVNFINWQQPEKNHFAIAEEVTVKGNPHTKRPDIVLYINGIALGVIELKRSTTSVAEGIRQNLDNQKRDFIQNFFATMQLVMAANDTEGLRYGTIETKEKYYLEWKEGRNEEHNKAGQIDQHLAQICSKKRFLELIHDFIVFDAGKKKLCRHNQYFGIKAAQGQIRRREGGIIWHTQGSGKSLTMVWLAKWIRENVTNSRVLIITDRRELDKQIGDVFTAVEEKIRRTKSGHDLIEVLNAAEPALVCSLVHKFAGKEGDSDDADFGSFVEEITRALPKDFKAKGNLFVFVDECHRTQSGELHKAMKTLLPGAMFIGFTGTPLLKADKQKSIEAFGPYIHTYKFDEAVKDGVVLDLRYEARDIDQSVRSQDRIDQWFEIKTRGLNDVAKAQLKKRWGTMQKVLSSQSRLEKIVADILLDMETKPRLMSGRGNAILVSSSIYQACKFYELFSKTDLAGKCAIVTSYVPSAASIKGEESGEGQTEKLNQYEIYRRMLADWFNEPAEIAINKVSEFEDKVKEKFQREPGQMKLLIVVDKLLTGFDAPPASYLYIDKEMRDHGLFQAICRVNRLDTDDKDYGYIVDYKDLFKKVESAFDDYTSGALDGYAKEDVAGLLEDRLEKARDKLEESREAIKALCEPVERPKDTPAYLRYFLARNPESPEQLKECEGKRLALYKMAAAYLRSYSNLANDMEPAGFDSQEAAAISAEVDHYIKVREEVKRASGDYIDLKLYEPAMRHLIDAYIRAEDSRKISAFDDLSLVQIIVEKGISGAVNDLPKGIRESQEAVAETIEANVRRLIVDEKPVNPKYYEKMSELLNALVERRKKSALDYQQYLQEIVELAKKVMNPMSAKSYPSSLDSNGKRALYDNLGQDESLALAVDKAIRRTKKDDWRGHAVKERELKIAIRAVLERPEQLDDIFELIKAQREY